jgi:hypothetical protein
MRKGNKGEWSEVYALLKLLAEKQIFGADKNLEKIPENLFKVQRISRQDSQSGVW